MGRPARSLPFVPGVPSAPGCKLLELLAEEDRHREFGEQLAAADGGAAGEMGAAEDFAPSTCGRQGDLGPEIGWATVTVDPVGQVRRHDDERLVAVASGKSAKPVREPSFASVERLVIARGK